MVTQLVCVASDECCVILLDPMSLPCLFFYADFINVEFFSQRSPVCDRSIARLRRAVVFSAYAVVEVEDHLASVGRQCRGPRRLCV